MNLRKEPALNFISTAEAIALLLSYLEPQSEAPEYILRAFHAFVSLQIQNLPQNHFQFDHAHDTLEEILLPDHGMKKKKKLSNSELRSRQRLKEKRKRKHRH